MPVAHTLDLRPPLQRRTMTSSEAVASGARARLRRRLVAVDLAAVSAAWLLPFAVARGPAGQAGRVLAVVLVTVAVTMLGLAAERLYQSRVAMIRSEEVARIARVTCMSAIVAVAGTRGAGADVGVSFLAAGTLGTFLALTYGRGRFQSWISEQRSVGNFARRVVIVGDPDEASTLVGLLQESPELGVVPVGFTGSAERADVLPRVPWLGTLEDVEAAVAASGAGGVVICASSMPSVALNDVVRRLHQAGIHVLVSSGIEGVHRRRLRVQPVAYQPLIYVEAESLSQLQLVGKRVLDVVGATIGLIVAAPVLLVAAVAIKGTDRGPVFFRQERIGRDGRAFTILKLRTMCIDAEARFDEVRALNERQGPLFKLSRDPRVTPVGRFLRNSSIDELPQLVNVLTGTMSLVGPRPALRSEVAQFDRRLIERLEVKPGMTGLWQVEARDKVSFEAYRRLDLFYVENWSVWLDVAILLKTVRSVLHRLHGSDALADHASPDGRDAGSQPAGSSIAAHVGQLTD